MQDEASNGVDDKLYGYILKVVLLEYANEVRFRTSIISAADRKRLSTYSRPSAPSESILPAYVVKALKAKLQDVMTKKNNSVDEKTRRTLLRLYGDLLDTKNEADSRNIDFLIAKFASYANQELKKIGVTNEEEVSAGVFEQTTQFIDMIIVMLKTKKDADQGLVLKLHEHKDGFKGRKVKAESKEALKFPTKSYRLEDMNNMLVQIVLDTFKVNKIKMQADVFKYKDFALPHLLHEDVDKFFELEKEKEKEKEKKKENDISGKENSSGEALKLYNERQLRMKSQVKARYKLTPGLKNSPTSLPLEEQFYTIPRISEIRSLYVRLTEKIFETQPPIVPGPSANKIKIIDPSREDFLNIVGRIWLVDCTTRAAALYHAGHVCNALASEVKGRESHGISLDASDCMLQKCRHMVEEGGLQWDEKNKFWGVEEQESWGESLILSYNQLFVSLKDCFNEIFNETNKPSFGPYLEFLGMHLESDPLFPLVESTELPKKWEKRLTKNLLKLASRRYESYLKQLPRDGNLGVLQLLNICDAIVSDIKMLQKRYKRPFLGFLNIAHTVASITTGMFASDAKMIFQHIESYSAKRDERIATADALEIYSSLREIRSIYYQVTSRKNTHYEFDLESSFFKYLNDWVEESNEKLQGVVEEALKKDDFQPLDIEVDERKNSRAVLDIVAIIRQYLSVLNKQQWSNEYQLAKIYTKLLKSVSNSAILYALRISSRLNTELLLSKTIQEEPQEKSSNWFSDVKNAVSNIHTFSKSQPEVVFNFEPQTCVALNNIAAMMENLTRLEDSIDPESVSRSVAAHEPNARNSYLSHVFTVRVVRGENLASSKESSFGRINPYVVLVDVNNKKQIGRTRTIKKNMDPDWDEEFEITIPAESTLELSCIVWSDSFGQQQVCGKAFFDLNPKKFKHNGIPEEISLNLDISGKLILEVAVESETTDAMFVMGRSYRALKRVLDRSIKLMVEKFQGFIGSCFSKSNLKTICAKGQPAKADFEASIETLCDYLNMNLSVLKQYLRDDIFMEVMIATWKEVIKCADDLLLPKLSQAIFFENIDSSSWQQAMSSKIANVSITTMNMFGFDSPLTSVEIETVLRWLDLLTEFFHNDGNGPPLPELKTNRYQSLLLIPAFYDQPDDVLVDEVENLSSAYMQMLISRNSSSNGGGGGGSGKEYDGFLKRAGSLSRSKTIYANATAKTRAQAAKEDQEADPYVSSILKEDIILRVLLARGRKDFVRTRMSQRTKIAYSLATERMAKLAAERFQR
ncbi:uncharacterized protein LODBEIA_P30330 [Lodderomyces beijingensis]|uniref:Uncharacterized protein n=1 Tax=Lodderomyces beijingensis TaxID=1775926 RepID=A0ABP0ZLQ9_9ASCO